MKTSADGIAVMHYFEFCVLHAYPDPASALGVALQRAGLWAGFLAGRTQLPAPMKALSGAPWTIGWGDTGPDVVPGLVINQAQADERFARRLEREFEPGVEDALQNEPTQAQFDGMVSLAYNIGVPAFRSSTVLRKFNLRDDIGAAEAILMWNKSGGRVMLGLRRRRAAERARFLGASGQRAIEIGKAVQ